MAVTQDFVFVNKTGQSSSLSRSQGLERSRIFSQAQQRVSTQSPEGFVIVTPTSFTKAGKNGSKVEKTERRLAPDEYRLPIKEVASADFDPFQSFPIHLHTDMQSMLAYYYHNVLPWIWPPAMLPTARQDLTDFAVSDPAVIYAILGLSNAVILSGGSGGKHARHVSRFRCQTVIQIRKSLRPKKQRVNATTVHAIALLMRLECGQGDLVAAKVHFDGLVTMLESIKSFAHIPYTILSSIQASLLDCALMLGRCPPDLISGWSEESMLTTDSWEAPSPPNTLATTLGNAPFMLSSAPYHRFLGGALVEIITKWHRLNLYKQCARQEGLQLPPERLQTLHAARLSLEHRLVSLTFPVSLDTPYSLARPVIRLALCIISGPPINISLPDAPYQTLISRQMQTALQQSLVTDTWSTCPDLLLWSLTIAGYVSYQQPEWSWIVSHATLVCGELGIESLAEFQGNLFKFGLVPDRFTGISRIMWICVQANENPEA